MLAGFLAGYKIYQAQRAVTVTEENMTAVQEALGAYVAITNKYPIPAHYGLTEGDAAYGKEGTNIGTCANATDAVGKTCRAATGVPAGKNVLTGMVPFAELNLTPQMVRDGYGRMLTYAVSADLTATNGADPVLVGSDLVYNHHVCVEYQNIDVAGNFSTVSCAVNADPLLNNPPRAIALVSHGKDGIGAWLPSGRQFQACGALADGSQNNNCNFGGRFTQATATTVRVMHDTGNTVNEGRRPAIMSATGSRLNDDTLQTEIREDTNFWALDPTDNIANRYSYHVGIGLSTAPDAPLDVGGRILVEEKILAEELCKDGTSTCLETAAIAGQKPEMECSALGMVETVHNNVVKCMYPVASTLCPGNQYATGFGPAGQPICVDPPYD